MFKTRISGIAVAVSLLMLPTIPSLVSAADEIEEVVAVGTRREARSVGDSPAPVDIISGSDFTNQGAAIEKIRFLTTKRGKPDEYVFNQSAEVPSFSLGFDLDGKLNLLDFSYDIYLVDDNKVEFVYSTEEMTIRRIYELEDNNYLISHETVVKNLSSSELSSRDLYLNLGTSFPINDKEMPNYLTVGCFDGKDAKFTAINKLKNKKNIERIGRFNWVSLQNQYFAGILMPETPIKSVDI